MKKQVKNFEIKNRFEKNPHYNNLLIKESHGYSYGSSQEIFEYVRVSLDLTHKNFKFIIDTQNHEDGITWQWSRFEDDSIANYISNPERLISQEAIDEAKKILKQNHRKMNQTMKVGQSFKHWQEMKNIIDSNCLSYKSDFEWTTYKIGLDLSENKPVDFIWIIKEAGDAINESYWIQTKNFLKVYRVTNNKLEDITSNYKK